MKRKRIFIFDYAEQDIVELRRSLINSGYEVLVYQDPENLALYLEKQTPDLIVVETRLPGLDLAEFISSVRAAFTDRIFPIVATSALRTIEERIQVFELEIDEFIYKPYEPEEAVVRIENLIKECAQVAAKAPVTSRGFSGALAEMTLVDLLQTLEVGKKTGVITLSKSGAEGKVYVSDGEVVNAQLGALEAKQALLRMFTWSEGHFYVEMLAHEQPKVIADSTQDLVSEGMTRQFRWEQLVKELPSLRTVVVAAATSPDAPPMTVDEEEIHSRLNGSKSILEIVEECKFDDLKALRLLKSLYNSGRIQALEQAGALREEQLTKYTLHAKNGNARSELIAGAFSGLYSSVPEAARLPIPGHVERRRRDRRRTDRRRDGSFRDKKVWLNKAELILFREKLLSNLKSQQ